MKYIFYIILFTVLLSSCDTSKNYLQRKNEDKALRDVVKKLNKNGDDYDAVQALPILYNNIQAAHLAKIKTYAAGDDAGRWDGIIEEYEALQTACSVIINSTAAFKLITPQSYSTQLLEAKQDAAAAYYAIAQTALDNGSRENAKKAYTYFKKAEKYLPGYKDAAVKMVTARENAVINVVISPVRDDAYFFNTGWGNAGYNYGNDYFQHKLVRELQNQSSDRYAARFYTDIEARRENVKPDWIIDLQLKNVNIPYPVSSTSLRNLSAQVENGKDTAGRILYKTVYASLNITQSSFTARGDMEVDIKNIETGRLISYHTYSETYRWSQQRATYTGDSRALAAGDWDMVNNSGNQYSTPRKEDILNELYRKMYPEIKSNILFATGW